LTESWVKTGLTEGVSLTGTWVDKRSVKGDRLKGSKAGRVGVGWTGSWLDAVFILDYLHNKALKSLKTICAYTEFTTLILQAIKTIQHVI
jgi:hypothetical protein